MAMSQAPSTPPRNYLPTVLILVGLDIAIHLVSAFMASPYVFLVSRFILHGVIGVWIGAIINWLHRGGEIPDRKPVILYWGALGLSFFTGVLFSLIAWLTAAVIIMKTSYADMRPDHPAPEANDPEAAAVAGASGSLLKTPKGIWPAYAAVLVLIAQLGFIIFMTIADTSEFRGLGLLFLHIFVTPFFIIVPGFLRIPAAAKIKTFVIGVQMVSAVLIVISWLVFFLLL